jgi:hypothetical protein
VWGPQALPVRPAIKDPSAPSVLKVLLGRRVPPERLDLLDLAGPSAPPVLKVATSTGRSGPLVRPAIPVLRGPQVTPGLTANAAPPGPAVREGRDGTVVPGPQERTVDVDLVAMMA